MIPYNSTTSHVTKCIGDGEKSCKCDDCPAVFKTEGSLRVHVTNKSCPVKCNQCDKTLKNAGYLDKHMASAHSVLLQVVKTSEGHIGLFQSAKVQNDLHCTLCDFIGTKPSLLKRHMITHNPKPDKVKEKCPKCDLTFKYTSDYNRHIKTPHRDYVKGNSRANQYRKIKKLNVAQAHLKQALNKI